MSAYGTWSQSNAGLRLTGRQLEVVRLRREGLMLKEIAYRLGISMRAVSTHLYRAAVKGEPTRPCSARREAK